MKYFIILSLAMLLSIQQVESQVQIRDTLVEWSHFAYELTSEKSIADYSTTEIEQITFDGIVIENSLIKLTLIPEFGGRIISYIYKPTGHEQLYQNPNGIPYAINQGTFYYRWLMVYGGIFATFPEPEHGKTWLQPWNYSLVNQSSDSISIQMSLKDTIDFSRHDGRFNNGVTGLECTVTVSVYRNKSSFDMEVSLSNPSNDDINYEYWTCTTLAPGSDPANPKATSEAEMIVPVELVKLKDDWWSWMSNSETAYNAGEHLFYYDNLAHLKNWEDMGIAYAYPSVSENYWGVINHGNEEGILRIADNMNKTPGMKFWTWGNEQGQNAEPYTFSNGGVGPYIELWAGHSNEFFKDAHIQSNETITWTESYLPTVGLPAITAANKNAAAYITYTPDYENSEHVFQVQLFTTLPYENTMLTYDLGGVSPQNILQGSISHNPDEPYKRQISVPANEIEAGTGSLQLNLEDEIGNQLLSANKEIELANLTTIKDNPALNNMNLDVWKQHVTVTMKMQDSYLLSIYDLNAQLVDKFTFNGNKKTFQLRPGKMYIIHIISNRYTDYRKVFIGY